MKTILVIEDQMEIRENIAEILELDGYKVFTAENGKSGVRTAMNEQIDLILCDVMMPELDGFGVLKILSKNPKTNTIPFIFLTAKAEKADQRKGMGLGADDYITKPFDDTDLLNVIEVRLAKSARLGQLLENAEKENFFEVTQAESDFSNLFADNEERVFPAKSSVYDYGQHPRWLYFIKEGRIKVSRENEIGKKLITRILEKGSYFGFETLLQKTSYQESAIAIEDSCLLLISNEDFQALLFEKRQFAIYFIKLLSNKTEGLELQLLELAYSSVRKKVANTLLQFATIKDNNKQLSVDASREDLASLAGTAKETLIRTLSNFKAEGLIKVIGSTIVLIEPEKLKDMPQ